MSMPPPMPQPPLLPYQTPPARAAHAAGAFDWNIFLRALVLVLATIAIVVLVIPRFADTFADFKTELPASTKALLALQRTVAGGWWLALLAIPPGLGFLVGQFGPVGRRLARMAIVLAFGAFVVFVALGIVQPMLTLMEGLSSPNK